MLCVRALCSRASWNNVVGAEHMVWSECRQNIALTFCSGSSKEGICSTGDWQREGGRGKAGQLHTIHGSVNEDIGLRVSLQQIVHKT